MTLDLPVAGPTSRMLAYAIDWIAVMVLSGVLLVALLALTPLAGWLGEAFGELAGDPGETADAGREATLVLSMLAFGILIQLVVEWGYFVFFELVTSGRSPGKAALSLGVVRDDGLALGLRDVLVRNLLRMVDLLPASYVVGLVSMLVSDQGKRLGDLAAGTVVVRLDRPPAALPLSLDPEPGEPSFRFERAHMARVSDLERALARQTLRRLAEVPGDAAEAALERAVETLRASIGFGAVAPEERRAWLRALLRAATGGSGPFG